MSGVLLARIDVANLYPPFLDRLYAVVNEAQSLGSNYWAISGTRTYAEQMKLWAQGRTLPGPIVTQARGGESAHNFGLAVDFCRDGLVERAGLQPDWRPESYDLLGQCAVKHGLVWGGSWKFRDCPHIQWGHRITALELAPLRDAYSAGGLKSVWEFLDREALNA